MTDASHGVLVVEELAHTSMGHYPNRFMELAIAFADAGIEVATLTSRGWNDPQPDRPSSLPVHRYGRRSVLTSRVAYRLARGGAVRRHVASRLHCRLLVREVRRATRRMHADAVDVVVVGAAAPAMMLPRFVRSGRWIVHVFQPEPIWVPRGSKPHTRSVRRTNVTIAVPTPDWIEAYRATCANVACIPLAGIRTSTPIADARARLDIEPDRRIALYFGAAHTEKDAATVARAFNSLSDWQLLLVGRGASRPEFQGDEWAVPPVTIDGFVDGATRALAFDAADAVVLSFVANYRRNSGTFMDAMAHSVPVVVSNDSLAADLTEQYGVGITFTAGDADSLRQAMGCVPTAIAPDALASIRSTMSNDAVVRAHLTALAR